MGRVRGRVAYVVAVIGQEKSRDQTTRRVVFVQVVPLPDWPQNRQKYSSRLSCSPLSLSSARRVKSTECGISALTVFGSVFNIHVRTDHSPCPKLTAIKRRAGQFLFLQIILS